MNSIDRPRNPVAYKNEQFLDSDDARPLRILAEYLEPMQAFHRERVRDTIVFFGAEPEPSPRARPCGDHPSVEESATPISGQITETRHKLARRSEELRSNSFRAA